MSRSRMVFDERQRRCVERIFDTFDGHDIEFVVLRDYDNLPASTDGNDIDVLVREASFDEAIAHCRDLGFEVVETEQQPRNYLAATLVRDEVRVDLVNHLAYKTPMEDPREDLIRIDASIEERMFERRVECGDYYVPSAPDGLVHLTSRGVFDREGEFPDRYERACDDLVAKVQADEEKDEQFRTLLEDTFYGAYEVPYEAALSGEYDEIRPRLKRYADY